MTRTLPVLAFLLLLVPTALAVEQEHQVHLHEYSGGFHIIPEQIVAKVGDVLKLTVINTGESPHNLLVCGDGAKPQESCADRWGFTGMIASNETATMQATVKESGTFEYYCYIAGHKGAGMTGILQVACEGGGKSIPALPVGIALAAAAIAVLAWRRRS